MTRPLSTRELAIVVAVHKLHGQGYGVTLRDFIEEHTGDRLGVATIYGTLERLEAQGLVKSRMGEKTAERGGRRKKYFELTGSGVQAMSATFAAMEKLRSMSGPVDGLTGSTV